MGDAADDLMHQEMAGNWKDLLPENQLQAWGEYRVHGGKLDFTAWQEKQARDSVAGTSRRLWRMTTNIIGLEDMSNLAIQVGIQENSIMNCWEVSVMLGNIKDHSLAEKLAKVVRDIIWEEFSAKDAKHVKSN